MRTILLKTGHLIFLFIASLELIGVLTILLIIGYFGFTRGLKYSELRLFFGPGLLFLSLFALNLSIAIDLEQLQEEKIIRRLTPKWIYGLLILFVIITLVI